MPITKTILLATVERSCSLHSMVGVTGAKLLASFLALWLTYDAKILSIKMPRILFPLHTGVVQLKLENLPGFQEKNILKNKLRRDFPGLDEALCKSMQHILHSHVFHGDFEHPLKSCF